MTGQAPVSTVVDPWPGALVARTTRKSYSFEFRAEAVRRALAGGSKSELAKELELSTPKLREKWVRTYPDQGQEGLRPSREDAVPGHTARAGAGGRLCAADVARGHCLYDAVI